jgi:hypothetical protein
LQINLVRYSDRTKLDKSKFTDLDNYSAILLQVFDSAYKSFLNHKKEKSLIFGLNEKVVQLNNLIDTVIETSRYDKRSVLFELALERISSLTNASAALLQISKENKIENQYSFPLNISAENVLKSEFKLETAFTFNGLDYKVILVEKETRLGLKFNDLDKLLLDAVARQVRLQSKTNS